MAVIELRQQGVVSSSSAQRVADAETSILHSWNQRSRESGPRSSITRAARGCPRSEPRRLPRGHDGDRSTVRMGVRLARRWRRHVAGGDHHRQHRSTTRSARLADESLQISFEEDRSGHRVESDPESLFAAAVVNRSSSISTGTDSRSRLAHERDVSPPAYPCRRRASAQPHRHLLGSARDRTQQAGAAPLERPHSPAPTDAPASRSRN